MIRPLLLGLTGAAGAGKTTVAAYLEHEWGVLPVGLADPILAMICALFDDAGVPDGYAVERGLKERPTLLGYSYRHLAQTLGTAWGRDCLDAGFWLRQAAAKIAQIQLQGAHAVVTDVRFPDEAEWLRKQGGLLVRIERDIAEPVRAHESEAHWRQLPADEVIVNGAGIDSVHRQVDEMMVRILERAA